MEIGTSEAEPIWVEFLRKLTRRGLCGVKFVVSNADEGLKAAATKVLCATWQRCRVHVMKNVLTKWYGDLIGQSHRYYGGAFHHNHRAANVLTLADDRTEKLNART
jgi:hypothetical protein